MDASRDEWPVLRDGRPPVGLGRPLVAERRFLWIGRIASFTGRANQRDPAKR
jgi:hypothetical protein